MIRLTNEAEGLDAKRVRLCMRFLELNECTHPDILAIFGTIYIGPDYGSPTLEPCVTHSTA